MKADAQLELLPLDLINEPPHQLRETVDQDQLRELADSMARLGLLQPIGVALDPATQRYTIVYGHRRFLAALKLGWATIPAQVLARVPDAVDIALAENLHRAALSPVEEARALGALRARGRNIEDLAHVTRKSEAWVRARLALLDYPLDLQEAVHAHGLPLSVADLLLQVDHAPYRAYLIRDAIAHGSSARTVAVWVQHFLAQRDYVVKNTDMVEELRQQRNQYKLLVPCEYCGEDAQLEHTRSWRLCPTCTQGLRSTQRPDATT